MAYDFGDTVRVATPLLDPAGSLANAVAVTLTITKPDGTTATPAVANPPAQVGQYTADYVTDQAGRHVVRWEFTTPTATFADMFDVRPADPGYIVSLADAMLHVNLPTSTSASDKEELRRFVEAVTDCVEYHCGPVVVRTYVERHDSCAWLLLTRTPVLSVTTVAPWRTAGTTYAAGDLRVEADTGRVERKDGGYFTGGPFEVTYRAGRTIVPAAITTGALDILMHLWKTQRAGARLPRQGGGEVAIMPGSTYTVPLRALEVLQRYKRPPMVG